MQQWGRRIYIAGAVMLIILGLVHSLSLFRAPVPANETERQLIELMDHYRFNVLGSMRTMGNFLQGFSIAFMLAALGFGAVDLALLRERTGLLKRVALVNVLWLAAMVATALRYFFIVPTTFLGVTLLLFVLAWIKLPGEAKN
jgi:uncharacterized membrane protein YhhN